MDKNLNTFFIILMMIFGIGALIGIGHGIYLYKEMGKKPYYEIINLNDEKIICNNSGYRYGTIFFHECSDNYEYTSNNIKKYILITDDNNKENNK